MASADFYDQDCTLSMMRQEQGLSTITAETLIGAKYNIVKTNSDTSYFSKLQVLGEQLNGQ